jgi:hypothetical protein
LKKGDEEMEEELVDFADRLGQSTEEIGAD